MRDLTIVTIVNGNKGDKLNKFLYEANRYANTHKILVVMGKDHGVSDPEALRDKYKSLDIQYHYTQVEPVFENLLNVAESEINTNKSIYLGLENPAF